MPFGDGTGPWGMGPRTGWGLGPCGLGLRRRWGIGRGRGLGRRWFWQSSVPYQPTSKKEELDILKEEADALKEELKEIESAIQDLKETKKKK